MNHASFFSGIGAPEIAAQWLGWNNVLHCEINPFSQKILKYYWPHATSYTDITQTDFTPYRGLIDVLSGGFPCQPYSVAGKRLGKEDERHLWPHMLRGVQEMRPRYVVGENVRGIVSWNEGLVFDEVCADLEAEGYEVLPFILPACAVNAPHRRERVWFVAYANSNGAGGHRHGQITEAQGKSKIGWEERQWLRGEFERIDGEESFADTNISSALATDGRGNFESILEQGKQRGQGFELRTKQDFITNTEREGLQKRQQSKQQQPLFDVERDDTQNVAYAKNLGLERIRTRRIQKSYSHEEQKIFMRNGFDRFPTQSPVCSGDDGISTQLDGITFSKWRNESIKAFGNSMVPQVIYQIFKAIDIHNLIY